MASDKPDDSVKLYSVFDRPEGEVATMGEISVYLKLERKVSAYNGWVYLHADNGKPSFADFEKKLKEQVIEMAKKRAKELHANAIVDLRLGETECGGLRCTGTAVRALKLAKKESSSEEGNNNIKKEEDDDTPPIFVGGKVYV